MPDPTGRVVVITGASGGIAAALATLLAVFRSAYNGCKHFPNAITATFRSEVQQTHPGIQQTIGSA